MLEDHDDEVGDALTPGWSGAMKSEASEPVKNVVLSVSPSRT